MKRQWCSFNLYLLLAVMIFVSCKSTEDDEKEGSTFMVYLGTILQEDGLNQTVQNYATNLVQKVEIYRANPVSVVVDREAFVTTGDVIRAEVVEDWGGYHIEVELDRRGSLVLESVTASNVGRRMVIQSRWDDLRWIAAPLISNRIANGIISFVPDATREESDRIVLGLNNVAEELHKENRIFSDKWETK